MAVLPPPAAPSAGEGKTVLKAHVWARDPDDWYVESDGSNQDLFAAEQFQDPYRGPLLIVDPFCGMGRILDAAKVAGYRTLGMDKVERQSVGLRHPWAWHDFDRDQELVRRQIEYMRVESRFAVVTNPPYIDEPQGACIERIKRIIHIGAPKTAILMRIKWANGRKVAEVLESLPLRRVRAISPRPSMPPGGVVLAAAAGAVDEKGDRIEVGGGKEDFAWFIFERGYRGEPAFGWCRQPKVTRKRNK